MAADLVVLDPRSVAGRATYLAPHRPPAGIELVVVGGRPALDARAEVATGRSGRVLR